MCSVVLETWSRFSGTPTVPISDPPANAEAFRTVMAEDAFKHRLAESSCMKLQAILPLIKTIIKSNVFEVIFTYRFQGRCSDSKFKKPHINVPFTSKDKTLFNLQD